MAILALFVCITMIPGFAGCKKTDPDTGVAAVVNGVEILEATITDMIMGIRNKTADYAEDAIWALALSASNLTPESLREQMIMNEARVIVFRQEAEAQGLVPDYEAIDAEVARAKLMVGGDDKTWNDALKSYGYKDEADFRSYLELNNLQKQMMDTFEPVPTAEELKSFVVEYAKYYTGSRRSSAMYFPAIDGSMTEDFELKLLEIELLLEEGADFIVTMHDFGAVNAAETDDADMGWDSVANLSSEYQSALRTLDLGEATHFIAEDNRVFIILCTELFDPADDETIDYDSVPRVIVDLLEEQWLPLNKSAKFNEFITQKVDESDLVINPMPSNLPYDVDMSLATDNTDNNNNPPVDPPDEFAASRPDAVQKAIEAGLEIEDIIVGEGALAEPGSEISVLYTGWLEDGFIFDSSDFRNGEPYNFTLGAQTVIPGWDAGVVGMRVGGVRYLIIPAELAYGAAGRNEIPPNATLYFEVELLSVKS